MSWPPWVAERFLDMDEDVLVSWRRMVEVRRKANHTFGQPDVFIAATASVHSLSVVTRNEDDVIRAEIAVFNPWTGRMNVPREG